MKSRGKRILTALMVAGALAGLLAIVFLPGRWDFGAQAHTAGGVQIIDTPTLCLEATHALDTGGTVEVQTVTIAGAPTGGTFTLTYDGQTTAGIAWNATAAAVETALELLSNITAVTGGGGALPGAAVTVDFDNPDGPVPAMTSDATGLTGGAPVITITETTPGTGGDRDCAFADVPVANHDAHPSDYLVDSDADTVADAIVVDAGDTVRVVAHARANATTDAPDGSDVTWNVTGSAVIEAVGLDTDADGDLDGLAAGDGLLTPIVGGTQTTIGDTVSDTDSAADGTCTDPADTCINGVGGVNPDGISIIEVRSGEPTSSTITASTGAGSDTTTIIWTGDTGTLTVTATLDDATDPNKTVAQTIIGLSGLASNEKAGAGLNGDPDVTITATARDDAGNPVSGSDIDCTLDSTGAERADIGAGSANNDEVADDPVADPAGNSALDGTTTVAGEVQNYLESENEAGFTAGDVTVTCWADVDPENDLMDTDEARGTVTVRVSGPPATVALAGNSAMTLGTQTLKATVTDADGEAVANDTNCTWLLIDPLLIAALTLASPVASDGNSNENILVAGAEGTITVSVTCGTATALISVTVSGALPTATTDPGTAVPTVTGTPPTATPVPPTPTLTPEVTPEPTVTTVPPSPLGDVNCDDSVDSIDASLILQLTAGLIDALPGC